jgi:hypothetical protein
VNTIIQVCCVIIEQITDNLLNFTLIYLNKYGEIPLQYNSNGSILKRGTPKEVIALIWPH